MQKLPRADDGIDRAGRQAARAADAGCGIDDSAGWRLFMATGRIQRQRIEVEQGCQRRNPGAAAGRTAIDGRRPLRERLGVGPAGRIAAARALGLRQQCIDAIDQLCLVQ